MSKRAAKPKGHLTAQILVGLIGAILSLALHELFHILMHWGHITHVYFFPSPGTIIELGVNLPPDYDIDGEEMVAYMITFIVVLITILIIFKIQDSEDSRSAAQILFPKDKEMQKMNPAKMLELSGLANAASPKRVARKPKRRKKKR